MVVCARLRWMLVLAAMLAGGAWAKGVTVEIVITGDALSTPLKITEPSILSRFSIWSGPNSRYRVEDGPWQTDYSSIYIDFPAGTVDVVPAGLLQFDVEFHLAGALGEPRWDETYRVRYAIDPALPDGYMYLPHGNPFIHHGVEGSWFRSTASWEASVRPLVVERLQAARSPAQTD